MRPLLEELCVPADRRERRTELVRGRRSEVALQPIQLPELGDGLLLPCQQHAELIGLLEELAFWRRSVLVVPTITGTSKT